MLIQHSADENRHSREEDEAEIEMLSKDVRREMGYVSPGPEASCD